PPPSALAEPPVSHFLRSAKPCATFCPVPGPNRLGPSSRSLDAHISREFTPIAVISLMHTYCQEKNDLRCNFLYLTCHSDRRHAALARLRAALRNRFTST